jgi:hypothetical protein
MIKYRIIISLWSSLVGRVIVATSNNSQSSFWEFIHVTTYLLAVPLGKFLQKNSQMNKSWRSKLISILNKIDN